MTDLEEFHQQLMADIQIGADTGGMVTPSAFFELAVQLLSEAGEFDTANRAYYEGAVAGNPVKVDGYGGDPRDAEGLLTLILCDFQITDKVRLIHKDKLQVLVNNLFRFLKASLKRDFREELDDTREAFGLVDMILTTWKEVEAVKLVIVSNADSRTQADSVKISEIDGRPVSLSLWDLKRLKQYMEQGQTRANLSIDFEKDFGGGIPMLPAAEDGTSFESYLTIIPGPQLAAIYDKWGPRLLEANVRSFLQARGKVNRGIRDTIRDEPHMFFSYNNGLSATADSVEVARKPSGLQLVRAENLQIVNGGQTTASIHAARKIHAEQLKKVRVQMKLTVVPRPRSEDVVPRISEYANSQNKVNAADFFANHPFHLRIEELSRKVLFRGDGGYRDTKWFYERARGQYADERGRRSMSERKRFDAEYPRSQFLTKTDLAKFENTWACRPYIVSLGAQKNFAEFARQIGKLWGDGGNAFDDLWFRRMIAKAIIFRSLERLVSTASWYEGGYRANIVTYAIAKLVHDAGEREMVIDLDSVWRDQNVSSELQSVLSVVAREAQVIITHPPSGVRNFSEWGKKQACWKWLEDRELEYPEELDRVLVSKELADETVREGRGERALNSSVDTQLEVHRLGSRFWKEAREWGLERRLLSQRESGVLDACARVMSGWMPTEKQCLLALSVLEKLRGNGFPG